MAAPHPLELDLTLGNSRDELPRLAEAVETLGARAGLSSLARNRINLVLEEVIGNTLAYGYPEGGEHRLRVRVAILADGIELEVRDDARPFDPLAERPTPYLGSDLSQRRPGGLGLYLVGRFVREGRYEKGAGGNRLIMKMDTESRSPTRNPGQGNGAS